MMIISCPSCETRYQIDPASLGDEGRNVRCSSCGHRWWVPRNEQGEETGGPVSEETTSTVEQHDAGKKAVDDAPPSSTVSDRAAAEEPTKPNAEEQAVAGARKAPPRRMSMLTLSLWAAAVLIVLVLAALVIARRDVVGVFPQAATIYGAVGLPVAAEPALELRNIRSERVEEGGASVLVVRGEIHNLTDRAHEVPSVEVALLDENHTELREARFTPVDAVLEKGGMTEFEARMNAGKRASNFSVGLAPN